MSHSQTSNQPLSCAVLVVSDSRTLETDTGGALIVERLQTAGHSAMRSVVPDDREAITTVVRAALEECSAIILTGGSGLAPRDVTPEAVQPLLTREIPGFGETFRRLSFDQVGAHGLLSRAFAGCIDDTLVFVLPGSSKACATAMDLIIPLLPHAAELLRQSS